jgi:hypothetical protein
MANYECIGFTDLFSILCIYHFENFLIYDEIGFLGIVIENI